MPQAQLLTPAQRRRLFKAAYPILRSPRGGMSINKKDYSAGQFLPGRQVYAQGNALNLNLPNDLNYHHLKSLDLHRVEPTWKKQGQGTNNTYGGVVFNHQGQVLLVEPSNHFSGYVWTFPKGGSKQGEHPVDTGLREVKEESGHDTSILGLIPGRHASPTRPGYSHYFLMRSHGQASDPHWETQNTRWAIPAEAHQLINKTYNSGGRKRDHAVLNAALAHLKLLNSQPQTNNYLQPTAQRQNYSKVSCEHTCSCTKCAVTSGLNRVIYARREKTRYKRIQRILYESRDQAAATGVYGSWIPRWRPQVTPAEFIAARNATKYPGFLSPLEKDEIKNHKLILSQDGTVGAALSPEGDIQNVFNNNGPQGAGVEAILELIHRGGHTLDAFDHFLPGLYSQFGFRETGRVKFNRDYAPPGWNYQMFGEPDVVFMNRSSSEPINEDEIRRRVHDRSSWRPHVSAGQYFDDWDQAKAHSRRGEVPRRNDPGPGASVGGSELESSDRERQGSGVSLAAQGHTQSHDSRSPLHQIARTATGVPSPAGTTTPAYQNILQRVRSQSSEIK